LGFFFEFLYGHPDFLARKELREPLDELLLVAGQIYYKRRFPIGTD